ncbi:Hypothetical protein A7982_04990 [Minicystis rosea]|nr:Hypothetical protein A7982_04990 [Minicystis rosea]
MLVDRVEPPAAAGPASRRGGSTRSPSLTEPRYRCPVIAAATIRFASTTARLREHARSASRMIA